jgi:hypothetical protein
VGLSNFQQISASFLLSCTRIFDLFGIQSLATITIHTYGVKTIEQHHESIRELRITEMQCDIYIYLRKRERKEDKGMLERIMLMLKYENRGVCIGFSWLRMKSNIWLWQDFKHFSSVRAWNVAIRVCKKECRDMRL